MRASSSAETFAAPGAGRRRSAWLLLLLLLALALRLYRLPAQSLWYDEGVTAAISQRSLADLTRWTAGDIQPPLYYILTAGWIRLAGVSEWALRFPSAAAGLLTLPLLLALHRRTWRLAGDRTALSPVPLLLLAIVAPAWVYYAQEARNYTLLTALCALAAYLVLRLLTTPTPRWPLLAAITAAATTALYTHYFALFLLLALAVFYPLAVWLRRDGQASRRLRAGGLVAAATLLLYVPWLPYLLDRYRVDASYWQGVLKLDEALRHLAIELTLGAPQMMLETTALGWLPAWGLIGGGALVGLGLLVLRTGGLRRAGVPLLFLALQLLLPTLLILLLAWRTPKFNPRYLLLVTPALYLLLGGGLAALWRWGRGFSQPLAGLLLLTALLTSALSLRNWFGDAAFAKADWRGVAAHVLSHSQDDEAVILVSGHALPVWDYYAPARQPLRLPAFDVLDVNQTLGYDVALILQAQAAGRPGAWLVLWQDNVVDPAGFVADQLARTGTELPAPTFGQIGLRHFSLSPNAAFSAEPPLTTRTDVTFGEQVRLVGWSQPQSLPQWQNEAAVGVLRLEWMALQPLAADLKLAGEIVDREGRVWGRLADQRLAMYEFPTMRWRVGEPVFGVAPLSLWPGTPPGRYDVRLRVYAEGEPAALAARDAAGQAQGTSVALTGVDAPALALEGPTGPLPPADAVTLTEAVRLAPELTLARAWLAPAAVEPGDRVFLALWWQTGAQSPAAAYRVRLAWRAPDGVMLPGGDFDLTPAGGWPTTAWPAQGQVLTQLAPRLPITLTGPDAVALTLTLLAPDGAAVGASAELPLAALASTRRFDPPPVARPNGADFGGVVRLLGADLSTQPIEPGATWVVTLTWQAIREPAADLESFVQMLDGEGRLRSQANRAPGARPTSAWLPGEVIVTGYTLTLPADLTPGTYHLIAGLYDPARPGLPRLLVQPGQADHAELAQLRF